MVSHQEKMINTFKMINELPKFDRYVEVFGEDGVEDGWYVSLFCELEKIEDNFDEEEEEEVVFIVKTDESIKIKL